MIIPQSPSLPPPPSPILSEGEEGTGCGPMAAMSVANAAVDEDMSAVDEAAVTKVDEALRPQAWTRRGQ